MSGRVFLVGAGPGDPDLLTVRATRILAEADVVLHDALIDPRVLTLAGKALRVPVGKRGGQPSIDQREIEAMLLRTARAGRTVVRLKCGDPFVFGRGGEEALMLHAAGVDFEIVPGVSSAIAGPGAAGIPVTHRGLSSGFAVLTARPAQAWHDTIDALPPGALTLVFLMSISSRAEIAARLQLRGWAPATPAAIVLGAHTPRQWRWLGSLAELGAIALPGDRADLPGLVVIGDVVGVAEQITDGRTSNTEDHLAIA
jgi:uroporphyrin-III C-methyltransferase